MDKYYVVVENGITQWFKDAKHTILHRTNGPAYESWSTKHWYINGKLHREDGPAVERASGEKEWYVNGKLHREDGPAFIHPNGNKFWYINGEPFTEEQFNARNKKPACVDKTITIDGVNYKLTPV